jgi:signal transduction histidine kinase
MSHELRTPLNAMLGFAQLLELDVVDADQQQSVAQVLAAGRHVVSLVDEILDIGRIEAGELQLDLRDIALGPVVAGALAMLAPLAAERGIELVEDVGAVGPVRADEDRLRQVLLNLVSNGVKYNHDGGRLVVAALRTPDAVRLSVRDTGWGMSQAQVDTLFVPFERLDAASRGINGTGLGLVVTQRLVEAMGGHLEVDSRPGVGTTFTLALPASPADPPRAP